MIKHGGYQTPWIIWLVIIHHQPSSGWWLMIGRAHKSSLVCSADLICGVFFLNWEPRKMVGLLVKMINVEWFEGPLFWEQPIYVVTGGVQHARTSRINWCSPSYPSNMWWAFRPSQGTQWVPQRKLGVKRLSWAPGLSPSINNTSVLFVGDKW